MILDYLIIFNEMIPLEDRIDIIIYYKLIKSFNIYSHANPNLNILRLYIKLNIIKLQYKIMQVQNYLYILKMTPGNNR